MTEKQIDEFICSMQKNYTVKLIECDTSTFKEILSVDSKSFLVPRILISFTDRACSSGRDFLSEVEELNKQVNDNKPLIIILVISTESTLDDNLWFNGNIFAHLLVHNEKLNCIYFEKSFHYLGAKRVRKLIQLLEQDLNC